MQGLAVHCHNEGFKSKSVKLHSALLPDKTEWPDWDFCYKLIIPETTLFMKLKATQRYHCIAQLHGSCPDSSSLTLKPVLDCATEIITCYTVKNDSDKIQGELYNRLSYYLCSTCQIIRQRSSKHGTAIKESYAMCMHKVGFFNMVIRISLLSVLFV